MTEWNVMEWKCDGAGMWWSGTGSRSENGGVGTERHKAERKLGVERELGAEGKTRSEGRPLTVSWGVRESDKAGQ